MDQAGMVSPVLTNKRTRIQRAAQILVDTLEMLENSDSGHFRAIAEVAVLLAERRVQAAIFRLELGWERTQYPPKDFTDEQIHAVGILLGVSLSNDSVWPSHSRARAAGAVKAIWQLRDGTAIDPDLDAALDDTTGMSHTSQQ